MAIMYQVVIDTNVLVAALRSRRGSSFRLLDLVGDPRWPANLSVALALASRESGMMPGAW
jgi:predicted nucleic acid-binding protein